MLNAHSQDCGDSPFVFRLAQSFCAALLFMATVQFAQAQVATMPAPSTYERACPKPAAGQMACHALRRSKPQRFDLEAVQDALSTPSGFVPADLQSAYKYDSSLGKGKTVAIVVEYDDPNAEADLAVYRSYFGLPPCTTANGCFRKINQDGQSSPLPAPHEGWAEEASLNLDVVSAVCPNCNLLLVEADAPSDIADASTALGLAVNQAAAQGAAAISNPYGTAEDSLSSSLCATYYTHPGLAVVVSAGDEGYGAAGSPASCPNVTAVGGTSLVLDGSARGWSETAWNGTSSGCSTYIAKPPYQTDAACSNRMVADVAAVADPNTGVAVYDTYTSDGPGWGQYGGTSVGSALITGVYALGNPPGRNAFPVIYSYDNPEAMFDVTAGADGVCSVPYLCQAQAGYDGPTGNGTPNGLDAFQPSQAPVVLTSSANPSTYHQIVNFSAKVVASQKGGAAPSGAVTFSSSSVELGSCTLEPSGPKVAKCRLSTASLAVGGSVIVASYSGDGSNSTYSESIRQVVGPTASKTRLKVKPSSPTQGQMVQLQAIVTEAPERGDIPNGTVSFYDYYALPSLLGTSSLNNGTAILSYIFADSSTHVIYAAYNGSTDSSASATNLLTVTVKPSVSP
jgi:hypothetical protein